MESSEAEPETTHTDPNPEALDSEGPDSEGLDSEAPGDATDSKAATAAKGSCRRGPRRGRWGALRWEAQPLPCAEEGEQSTRSTVLGGALGLGVGWLLGSTPTGRLALLGLGAICGSASTRYRVRWDWDPRAKGACPKAPSASAKADA